MGHDYIELWIFGMVGMLVTISILTGPSIATSRSRLARKDGIEDAVNKTAPSVPPVTLQSSIPPVSSEPAAATCPGVSTSMKLSYFIRVDKSGRGDFQSVQAAVDAVPENSQWPTVIQIRAGVYEEKVIIPSNKPFITMQGSGMTSTVITGNDTSAKLGTEGSATVAVYADHFTALDIGFKNAAPMPLPGEVGKQAVAMVVCGDKAAFYDCGFYGAQDTLFDYAGRHYFKNCFIEGSIDFIFGDGRSLYEGCQIHVIAESAGSITAQARASPQESSGFVFMDCNVTGTGSVWLGRTWGASSRVIFVRTYMDNIILPEGWTDFGDPSVHETSFYAQYKCMGPGAQESGRVPWSYELTDEGVQQFLQLDFIEGGTWLHLT